MYLPFDHDLFIVELGASTYHLHSVNIAGNDISRFLDSRDIFACYS